MYFASAIVLTSRLRRPDAIWKHFGGCANRADYDEAPVLTQAQAVAAVQIADGIIQVLDAVRQEPARSLIRDAMIVYERDVLHDVTWKP